MQLELRINLMPFKYLSNKNIINTQFMAASPLLEKTLSIEEWMAGAAFVK